MFSFMILIVIIFLFALWDTRKPPRYPPGPPWLPVFGSFLEYYRLYKRVEFTHLVWAKLSKQYGPLLGLRLGKDRLVIASGYTAVKEILSREEFNARPDGFFFRLRAFGERFGLVFVDGKFFKEQKHFCMRNLKSFGLNKSTMEDRITYETSELIHNIHKQGNKLISIPETIQVSVVNILWAMVAGERFNMDDPRPKELLKQINTSFRLQDMSGGILNQMPFLRFIAPNLSSFNKLQFALKSLTDFIKELVVEHRKSVCPYENRDLIDAYINEMTKHSADSNFCEKQLIIILLDLFLAGAETTTSTLGYAILYLIHYPHIQQRLQEEMQLVVGSEKLPSVQDRSRLKYMEAFLMELQRHSNVTPTTVSHRAKEDTEIMGCRIPENTIVIASLYSLHTDKDHWGDPENFRPERFLNDDGNLIQDDWLLPFGLGKRKCMGEVLARTSMYLFTTAILFNFTLKASREDQLPTLKALDGATISPQPFKCRFIPRNCK